jgi:hypothetical protein
MQSIPIQLVALIIKPSQIFAISQLRSRYALRGDDPAAVCGGCGGYLKLLRTRLLDNRVDSGPPTVGNGRNELTLDARCLSVS